MTFGRMNLGLGWTQRRAGGIIPGVLSAGAGNYNWSGDLMMPVVDHKLAATGGSYTYTGTNAAFLRSRLIAAAGGTYTYTGQDATLTKASGSYSAQGVNFDGTNDYLTRGAALTGAASGKKGIVSFWFRMRGGNNQVKCFLEPNAVTGAGYLFVRRDSSNKISIQGRGGFSTQLDMLSTATYTDSMSAWAHCIASWDLSATTGKIYVDGSDVTAGSPTLNNANLEYASPTNWGIGGKPDGTLLMNADIAELYVNITDYLDLSNSANVQKFRSAGGAPVDLGANGSTPTGNQPIIYLKNPTATWQNNLGSGGNFSVTGSLTNAASNPP